MALRQNQGGDCVVSFADDLSWGPIGGDANRRVAFFEAECPIPGGWDWLPGAHSEFWTTVADWSGDRLIWLGSKSACELAGYLAYLDRDGDRPAKVLRPDDYLSPHPVYGAAGGIGVLNPEQMADSLDQAPRRPVADDSELFGRWSELEHEDSLLRIVEDGRLISAPVDHFDRFVTDAAGEEWTPPARIVGNALAATFDARLWVNTDFLFSRVAHLVKSGVLEAQGNVLGWSEGGRREPALVRSRAI